jgi:hypothetical protein
MYLRLGMPFYLYKYPFHQCKSLYWDNPVRVGYNPPMSSFGMLLSDLLGVLFGAEPGETLTLPGAVVLVHGGQELCRFLSWRYNA